MVRVWDPLLRLFHWSLAASFTIAWVTAESWADLHEWAGYSAAALIGFRLIWGLIGPRYARFSQFVKSPRTVFAYLRAMIFGTEKRHLGHNPAGGAMILVLLAGLAATAWSGWMMTLPNFAKSGLVSDAHEAFASALLAFVLAHILDVFWAGWRHKENLAKSMLTGKKRAAEPSDIIG